MTTPTLAHPSHVSWPHRELHRGPQWLRSHGGAALFRQTPHAFRGLVGSSTESGTHNDVFTTAYGWVLRQDNFSIVLLIPPAHMVSSLAFARAFVASSCLGCGSESSEMTLGFSSEGSRGPWGPVLRPLGGLLGSSWGFLSASWGPLGDLLRPPGGVLGPKARNVVSYSPSGAPFGAFLGPSCAILKPLGLS